MKYGSTSAASGEFTEMYMYNEAGLVTKKRLRLKRSYQGYYPTGNRRHPPPPTL